MGEEHREAVSLSEEPRVVSTVDSSGDPAGAVAHPGGRAARPGPSEVASGVTLEQELDRLSLDRALVDVEIATGRVVDLTQRLVEATDLIRELQAEVEALRQERASLEQQLAEIRSTKAFRTADRLWTLRQGLRG